MKKEIYLDKIKEKTGIDKKYIDIIIKEYLELLKQELISNKKISITNFGTFSLITTKPHTIFSPIDGSKINTAGINKIYFKMSKDFQNKL